MKNVPTCPVLLRLFWCPAIFAGSPQLSCKPWWAGCLRCFHAGFLFLLIGVFFLLLTMVLQGKSRNCASSDHRWMVQPLSIQNIHFCFGYGRSAVPGCLSLCSTLRSFCTDGGFLNFDHSIVCLYLTAKINPMTRRTFRRAPRVYECLAWNKNLSHT